MNRLLTAGFISKDHLDGKITTYVQTCKLMRFNALFESASLEVSFSYYFIFDRTMCVLVTLWERGHFVMLIIRAMHLIKGGLT